MDNDKLRGPHVSRTNMQEIKFNYQLFELGVSNYCWDNTYDCYVFCYVYGCGDFCVYYLPNIKTKQQITLTKENS